MESPPESRREHVGYCVKDGCGNPNLGGEVRYHLGVLGRYYVECPRCGGQVVNRKPDA